tara:strand:+ start:107 stop:517 length:411 start_codon:yes stop_codon:yes gene_type:complete
MNNLSFIQFIDIDNTQHTVPTHMIRTEEWRKDEDDSTCYITMGARSVEVSWKTYNQILNALEKQYTINCCNAVDNEMLFPLKDLMSDYHITRARLAHELGVSKETVSLWVSNKRIIPDEYTERLHKFFEYQLELDH